MGENKRDRKTRLKEEKEEMNRQTNAWSADEFIRQLGQQQESTAASPAQRRQN